MIETISNTTSFPINWKERPFTFLDVKLHEGDIVEFPEFEDIQMVTQGEYKDLSVMLTVNGNPKYVPFRQFTVKYNEGYSCPILEKLSKLPNHNERLKFLCGNTYKVGAEFIRHTKGLQFTNSGKIKQVAEKKVYMPYLIKI